MACKSRGRHTVSAKILYIRAVRIYLVMIILMACCPLILSAQQAPQTSLSMMNPYRSIAAYAGFDGTLSVHGAYRSQWSGLQGSPEGQYISGHLPIYRWSGAVGGQLESERLGALVNTRISLSYNYIVQADWGYLSVGLLAGALQQRIDGSALRTPEGEYRDGSVNHRDPRLGPGNYAGIIPSLGLSVYYVGDRVEGGLQLSDFLRPVVSLDDVIEVQQTAKFTAFAAGHYSLPYDLILHPSVMLQSDFVQWQTEVAAWVEWRNSYGLGLGYRDLTDGAESLLLLAHLRLGAKWTLSYAHDLGLSSLQTVHTGSHEVMIHYKLTRRIGVATPAPVIHNPRLLD